jgi:hypothetical protein
VAAGMAISSPVGLLPFELPVDYAIGGLAAAIVLARGASWGLRTGRALITLKRNT